MQQFIYRENKTGIKLLKWILAVAAWIVMMSIMSIDVYAQEVSEAEPNDTSDQAQLIFANSETPSGCVNGTYVGQRVIAGTISLSDTDWYKVSLSSGTQYVTSNGASYNFDIYLENDLINPVYSDSYINIGMGITAHQFTATSSGMYYVKLTGVDTGSATYKFLIGSPTYTVDDYNHSFGSIYMNGADVTKTFSTLNNSAIPNGAIVYRISMGNLSSSNVNGVEVKNLTSGYSYTLSGYNMTTNVSVYSNVPMKANWSFKFKYKKTTTINPNVIFYYVYPIT